LLEGGPRIAHAFLDAGLVDKVMLFVAPVLAGEGPRAFGDIEVALTDTRATRIGDDVLLQGYVHVP